jgi:dihydrofolate synthase/folylpolyglutamate synthase
MKDNSSGYRKALKFIFDREHFGMKLGLTNISNFLDHIDNPHHTFRSVHIAGTNGKGSTAAYIDAIVRKAGYKVGIFTSPHLFDFRERIRVNGQKISRKFITDFIEKYEPIIDKDKITFFEVCTALAFLYFAKQKVDLAVVEVGLGGRLDATNTLSPLFSIITDISFDHMNVLGNTLTRIAYEKAGIIKRRTPVIIGSMLPEPRKEILRISRIRKSPYCYIKPSMVNRKAGGRGFDYRDNGHSLSGLRTSLPGRHQLKNAANAIKAAELLREFGFDISKEDIRNGLRETVWPGRFQILRDFPGPLTILDVGHNQMGVKAMADCFKEMFPGRKARILIGFVRHKNLVKTVKYLFPIAESVEIARLNTDRSCEPAEIAGLFPSGRFPVTVSNSLTASARRIILNSKRDDIFIIAGSHFAVGEFLENRARIYGRKGRQPR